MRKAKYSAALIKKAHWIVAHGGRPKDLQRHCGFLTFNDALYYGWPKFKEAQKSWRSRNPERVEILNKRASQKHYQLHKEEMKAYYKHRYHTDPEFRLRKIKANKKWNKRHRNTLKVKE